MQLSKAVLLAMILITTGCNKPDTDLVSGPYKLVVPSHFPPPDFETANPMTREGVALGRQLFYDVRLSGNNQVSCATCHDPAKAFTDGLALSKNGVSGTTLLRHAPPLFNLAWAGNGLFWDGGSTNLESQAFGPLTAHDEMAQNLYQLVDELNAAPNYAADFRNAFEDGITSQNVVKALAQFQRSLISAGSRYDLYKLGHAAGHLTADELAGLQLVKQNCQTCHAGELFTDQDYHNNGLDANFENPDHEVIYWGRYRISYEPADIGKFKTPSLRNVGITAPYMHDGRLATLEAVLEHYSSGIQRSATLDPRLPGKGLNLSDLQKKQIIASLHSLTDQAFIQNPGHQKPINQ